MPVSIWQAAAQEVRFASLESDLTVDVAIVGGGLTGVLCAHALLDQGMTVAVIEAARVGESSTGNSTGNLYALVGERMGKVDRKTVAPVCRARAAAVDLIENLVQAHDIDCGFVRCPWVMYSEQSSDALDDARELARAAELPTHDASHLLPFPVQAAVGVANQAQFNPLRFAKGLAAALASRGCRIHEETAATAIDAEQGRVRTRLGDVKAHVIVMATHTPKGRLLLHGELTPNREYGVAAPLAVGRLPSGIFWSADEPFRSVRTYLFNGREHLIVVGASHRTGEHEDTEQCYAELEAFARERFDVPSVPYRWSAQNYRAADGLPYIGRSELGDNVLVATGFAADGLTYAAVAAPLIADLAAGRPDPLLEQFDPRRVPSGLAIKSVAAEGAHMIAQFARDFPGLDRGHVQALQPGEAAIVEHRGEKLGAWRDDTGKLHVVSAVCTHMQCIVRWNKAERSWDCPCHGSRFAPDGTVLEGPAIGPLPERPAPV
jgi:glycine/D-amino acid oxidase-like deaminating enzyme/nitrite reductase/ring-hydroxylating ferredoxin subunit